MKILYWTVGSVLLIAALIFGLQIAASERVEVVVLHTRDATGAEVSTRLWIVDDAGFQYLRASDTSSGWSARVLAAPAIELTRNGDRISYSAHIREDKRARINELMQAKYTWGNSIITVMVGDRESATPLELHPL